MKHNYSTNGSLSNTLKLYNFKYFHKFFNIDGQFVSYVLSNDVGINGVRTNRFQKQNLYLLFCLFLELFVFKVGYKPKTLTYVLGKSSNNNSNNLFLKKA